MLTTAPVTRRTTGNRKKKQEEENKYSYKLHYGL